GRGHRAAPPGPEGDAPGADEPRRGDRPACGRRGGGADRGAGSRRPRRADGGALRPAHDRPGSRRGGRAAGGGLMLFVKAERSLDDLVVRGARVLDPAGGVDAVLDVRVDQGVIAQLGSDVDANGHRVVEGEGLVLAPAFVDPHVHLRVPGGEDEETIASGTDAAAAGGYCAILAMPNTDPVVDSAAVLGSLIEDAKSQASVPVGFLAAITRGQEGGELTEMAELADQGAAGFSDDGRPVVAPALMRRAPQYHPVTRRRPAPHREGATLSPGGPMHQGAGPGP